jgi:hypothetical protein
MKLLIAALLAVLLCGACAQGPTAQGGGGITMYGTIDEGVTFKK